VDVGLVFELARKPAFCHEDVAIGVDVGIFGERLQGGKVAFFHLLDAVFKGAYKGGALFTCNDEGDVKVAVPKGAYAHGFGEAFEDEKLGKLFKGALGKFAFSLCKVRGKLCVVALDDALEQG